jgi:hypothetical protein
MFGIINGFQPENMTFIALEVVGLLITAIIASSLLIYCCLSIIHFSTSLFKNKL